MRRKIVSITLDPKVLEEVRKWALREDRSVSYMINLFVQEGLKKPEKTKRILNRDPDGRYAHQ